MRREPPARARRPAPQARLGDPLRGPLPARCGGMAHRATRAARSCGPRTFRSSSRDAGLPAMSALPDRHRHLRPREPLRGRLHEGDRRRGASGRPRHRPDGDDRPRRDGEAHGSLSVRAVPAAARSAVVRAGRLAGGLRGAHPPHPPLDQRHHQPPASARALRQADGHAGRALRRATRPGRRHRLAARGVRGLDAALRGTRAAARGPAAGLPRAVERGSRELPLGHRLVRRRLLPPALPSSPAARPCGSGWHPTPVNCRRIAELGTGWLPISQDPAQIASGRRGSLRRAFGTAGRDPERAARPGPAPAAALEQRRHGPRSHAHGHRRRARRPAPPTSRCCPSCSVEAQDLDACLERISRAS